MIETEQNWWGGGRGAGGESEGRQMIYAIQSDEPYGTAALSSLIAPERFTSAHPAGVVTLHPTQGTSSLDPEQGRCPLHTQQALPPCTRPRVLRLWTPGKGLPLATHEKPSDTKMISLGFVLRMADINSISVSCTFLKLAV